MVNSEVCSDFREPLCVCLSVRFAKRYNWVPAHATTRFYRAERGRGSFGRYSME